MMTVDRPRSQITRYTITIALTLGLLCGAPPALAARIAAMESMATRRPHNAKAGVNLDALTRSVIAAAELNEWRPTFEKNGIVLAEKVTHEGKHRATVKISYDSNSFIVEYVTSHNLGYEARHCGSHTFGNPRVVPQRERCFGPAIHPNYNTWVAVLANSIADHVALLVAGDSGPAIRYALPTLEEHNGSHTEAGPALIAKEIRELKALADDGILSQQEYEARKSLLLAR